MSERMKQIWREYIIGAAGAIDLFPSHSERIQEILGRSDDESIRRDWEAVGKDIAQSASECASIPFGPEK